MKEFFKMMIASTIGVILGMVVLSFLSIFIFVGIAAAVSSTPAYSLDNQSILKLDLQGSINERLVSSNPIDLLMGAKNNNLGLNDVLNAIKKAKENDKIRGIYIKAGSLSVGSATLEPIRKALIDFKESGKFITAYGDFYTQATYYIASTADKVFMNPQGVLALDGMTGGSLFFKGALDKLGVKMQVFKVGTYKSAVEPYIQDKMSDANREQVTAFMNDIWDHYLDGISESRGISVDDLKRYADECMSLAKPEAAVEYGLIDELIYASQIDEFLKEQLGIDNDDDLKIAGVNNLKTIPFQQKKDVKEKIAILYAEGNIVGDEIDDNPFSTGTNITAKVFVKELKKLQKDDNIKAVVFRVNSRGGSAYASEQIWNAVKELKAVKPIVVSMGDYAASGGYYISCEAGKIIAEPTTLTGSIGIFGMFPDGEELVKKLGISHDVVTTNKYSGFGGPALPFPVLGFVLSRGMTSDERSLMQAYIERGYDLFLTRCAEGRSKTKEEIDRIAQGRVWTGNQALQLGLVDELGSLDDAVRLAAEAAGIEKYALEEYPAQKDFFTQLMEESFSGMQVYLTKQFLGMEKYELSVLQRNLKAHDVRQAVMEWGIIND